MKYITLLLAIGYGLQAFVRILMEVFTIEPSSFLGRVLPYISSGTLICLTVFFIGLCRKQEVLSRLTGRLWWSTVVAAGGAGVLMCAGFASAFILWQGLWLEEPLYETTTVEITASVLGFLFLGALVCLAVFFSSLTYVQMAPCGEMVRSDRPEPDGASNGMTMRPTLQMEVPALIASIAAAVQAWSGIGSVICAMMYMSIPFEMLRLLWVGVELLFGVMQVFIVIFFIILCVKLHARRTCASTGTLQPPCPPDVPAPKTHCNVGDAHASSVPPACPPPSGENVPSPSTVKPVSLVPAFILIGIGIVVTVTLVAYFIGYDFPEKGMIIARLNELSGNSEAATFIMYSSWFRMALGNFLIFAILLGVGLAVSKRTLLIILAVLSLLGLLSMLAYLSYTFGAETAYEEKLNSQRLYYYDY